MGKYIFLFAAAIFFLGIFSSSGSNRLIWFFTGVLFFSDRIMLFTSPTKMSFDRFLVYTLLLSELVNSKNLLIRLKEFPLIKSTFIFLLGMLFIGILDTRIGNFLKIYRPIDYFIQTILVTFLCYDTLKDKDDWLKLLKFLLFSSLLLCIFGFYNFFTKSNPLDHLITSLYHSVSPFDQYAHGNGRFRINSFVSHPIFYGYVCAILFLLSFYSYCFIQELKKISIISMPFILSNLILANSRTPLLAFGAGLLLFIFLVTNNLNKIRIAISVVIISLLVYNLPIKNERIEALVDTFKMDGGKTSGSTFEMRTIQLEASYDLFLKRPIVGHGLYYIEENLGWSDLEEERTSDSDFEGFESYIYQLLIEQGLIGILITLMFVFSITVFFLKNAYVCKEISALGLSILSMFLLYSFGTGTLHSWIISMGLIGICIKYLKIKEEELNSI